jgi:hypothetical protein
VIVIGNTVASDGVPVPTSAEIWDPSTSAWSEIADMSQSRVDFAAVSLRDDQLLVAGGLNDDSPRRSYSSAYIYDARAEYQTWSKTGLMLAARTGPSAALLGDGRVLVAGGYFHVAPDVGAVPNAELAVYRQPSTDIRPQHSPGPFDIDMGNAGAALATAELFDPATGTWTSTGPLNYARYGAAAVTLADGRVLLVGSINRGLDGFGVAVDPDAFDTAETYDPATGRFTLAGRLPEIDRAALEAQGEPGANPMPEDDGQPAGVGRLIALQDGGAVLIGYASWWKHLADVTRSFRFDAKTGAWSEIGKTYVVVSEPSPVLLTAPGVRDLSGAQAAAIPDGRVLVAGGGGISINGTEAGASDVAELYDPATDSWTAVPGMPGARSGGSAVALADGSVLLVGGGDHGATPLTTATRFVP